MGREPFTMVDTALVRERPDDLSGYARLVWVALKSHADAAGVCFPTVAALCLDTNWPRRTVERAVAELVAKGLLAREVHGAGRPNRYRVLPARPPTGANGAAHVRPPGGNGAARSGVEAPESRRPGGGEGANPASLEPNPASFESGPAGEAGEIPPNRPANEIQENEIQWEQDPRTRGNSVPNTERRAALVAPRAGALPPLSVDDSPEARRLAVVGVLVERCGRPANDGERGRYRYAAQQLEQAGADAAEVGRLADTYAARWPHLPLTPMALAKNVTTLRAPAPRTGTMGRQTLRDKLALLDDEGDR